MTTKVYKGYNKVVGLGVPSRSPSESDLNFKPPKNGQNSLCAVAIEYKGPISALYHPYIMAV